MNICYDHQVFSTQLYGGITRYFIELAKGIPYIDRNTDVNILAPLYISELLNENQLKIKGKKIKKKNIKGASRGVKVINDFFTSKYLSKYKPDLIHETYYNPGYKNKYKSAIITTVHDMTHEIYSQTYFKNDKTKKYKLEAIRRSDHIICISENTKSDLVELTGVDKDKISVIYHGTSNQVNYKTKNVYKEKPYLLYVGERGGYKNFERFIKAYANSIKIKKDFNVICVGGGKVTEEEIKLINNQKIIKNISFVKANDIELSYYYLNASGLVYPSLYEGFGLPIIEAMSNECPVFTSSVSSMPEIGGDAAFYFEPLNVESIKHTLEEYLYDRNKIHEKITSGKLRAKQFTWSECCSKTNALYKKFI